MDNAEVLVVTSGLSAAAHERHETAARVVGARAVAGPAGVSAARNRALEEAEDEDVIAYIDDDVVPFEDWLERLDARWRQAGDDVGCIGGAIEPRWLAPPPAWVSKRIHTAFSLLDLGPGLIELDPAAGQDVWAANISFRAWALGSVGAFDVRTGHRGSVPLFGEESSVQQRMAKRGLRVLYAGEIRVEHLIGPDRLRVSSLWRRQFFRGVNAGVSGAGSPAGGLLRAGKAAAGLAVALASGDRPLAGERTARVAKHLGVATTPLARRWLRRRHGWPGG
jgi:glycosyltransferase involved in cell wall biosynthesis